MVGRWQDTVVARGTIHSAITITQISAASAAQSVRSILPLYIGAADDRTRGSVLSALLERRSLGLSIAGSFWQRGTGGWDSAAILNLGYGLSQHATDQGFGLVELLAQALDLQLQPRHLLRAEAVRAHLGYVLVHIKPSALRRNQVRRDTPSCSQGFWDSKVCGFETSNGPAEGESAGSERPLRQPLLASAALGFGANGRPEGELGGFVLAAGVLPSGADGGDLLGGVGAEDEGEGNLGDGVTDSGGDVDLDAAAAIGALGFIRMFRSHFRGSWLG